MKERPVLQIPKTTVEKGLDLLSAFLLGMIFFQVIYFWNKLPNQIPIHMNVFGEVDGWGGKGTLLVLPIIAVLIFLPLFFLSRYPHVFNYPVQITAENAPKLYLEARRMLVLINFETILFFAITDLEIIRIALGKEGFGSWPLPLYMIALFGTMGIAIYRMIRFR